MLTELLSSVTFKHFARCGGGITRCSHGNGVLRLSQLTRTAGFHGHFKELVGVIHRLEEFGQFENVLADAARAAHLQPKPEQLLGYAVLDASMSSRFFHQPLVFKYAKLGRYGIGRQSRVIADLCGRVAKA